MACRVRESGNVSIIDVEENLDLNSSDIIETVGWLLNRGVLRILCNLANVDMVDYNGISILTIAYKSVTNRKGMMKFLNVPLAVMELLRLVRLDMLFECFYDEGAAVASFCEPAASDLSHLRRRFERLDVHLEVRYALAGAAKDPHVFEGEVLNISGAGIYVSTHHIFPMATPLALQLVMPGMPVPLEALGKIVWIPDKDLQPHSYPGIGIAFTKLAPEAESAILDFVEKNITHRAE